MRATIKGLGQWLPETVRDNGAWPADFGRSRAEAKMGSELTTVHVGNDDPYEAIMLRRSGAENDDPFRGTLRRRVADDAMSSSEAEALAGRAALADARVTPAEVDMVLSWAMVPDRLSPANATRVAHLVGASNASGIGVEAACASTVAQLTLAAAMIESGRARTVLCTQSHLINRANPLGHPASPMLGDAATAIVVGASERMGLVATKMASHGEYYDAVTWARGRDCDPPWWQAGGAFVAGTRDQALTMKLARQWVRMAAETINELCASAHKTPSQIDVIASVQPRKWLPPAICEAIGVDEAKAPLTYDELAHIGSCGIVTNLIAARERGMLRDGANVVLYGMGAGVTRAAALLEWRA